MQSNIFVRSEIIHLIHLMKIMDLLLLLIYSGYSSGYKNIYPLYSISRAIFHPLLIFAYGFEPNSMINGLAI